MGKARSSPYQPSDFRVWSRDSYRRMGCARDPPHSSRRSPMAAATSAISCSSPKDSLGTLPTSSVRRLPRCVAFFAMASAMARTIRTRSSPGTFAHLACTFWARRIAASTWGQAATWMDERRAFVVGSNTSRLVPSSANTETSGRTGRSGRSLRRSSRSSARSVSLDIFSRELARASANSGWPPTTA